MTGAKPKGNYRISIIPARAVTDPDISAQALRLLALLGRHTDENGWCRRSQVKMAEELSCGRATVQRSLDELTAAGYVEKREETRPGVEFEEGRQPHCSFSYRVRLDLEDDAKEGAHGRAGVVPTGEHGVPSKGGHGVPISRAPLTEQSLDNDPLVNSLAPAGAGEREGSPQALGKGAPERFKEFRSAWAETMPDGFPAKDEGAAEAEWLRQTRMGADPEQLLAATRLHGRAEADRAKRYRGGEFRTKLPSNWLRDRGWQGYLGQVGEQADRERETALALSRVQIALGQEMVEFWKERGLHDAALALLDGAEFQAGPQPLLTLASFGQNALVERHLYPLQRRFPGIQIVRGAQRRSA